MSKSVKTSPWSLRIFTFAFTDAGSVTSTIPFNDVNAIAFCAATRAIVATTLPLVEFATTEPDTLVSVVLGPFRLLVSMSPSTPSTVIVSPLMMLSLRFVRRGTSMVKVMALPFCVSRIVFACSSTDEAAALREPPQARSGLIGPLGAIVSCSRLNQHVPPIGCRGSVMLPSIS